MKTPTIRLGDAATAVTKGTTPTTIGYEFVDDGIPFLRAEDVTGGEVVLATVEKKITAKCHAAMARSQLRAGDVLITIAGTIGRVGVVPEVAAEANCNQAVSIVRLKPDTFDHRFLVYAIRSRFVQSQLKRQETTATVTNVSLEQIKNLTVPMWPLERQQAAVDILSRAEGIVRLRLAAQAKASELLSSLFLDMFGDPGKNSRTWEMATVGDVVVSAAYGTSKKALEDGAGIPMIRMGNVDYAGDLDLEDLKYLELTPEEVERWRLEPGDILFNRTNSKDLVGKTGLWERSDEAVAASYFIRVRVDRRRIRPFFFWAFMNTMHMKRRLFDTARGAIGQANINTKELRAFPIFVPPIDWQADFETWGRDVLSIRAQQAAALQKAEATFDTLMNRVFADQPERHAEQTACT